MHLLKEFLVYTTKKYSTQAMKSWSSYLNGEADKTSKGESKENAG